MSLNDARKRAETELEKDRPALDILLRTYETRVQRQRALNVRLEALGMLLERNAPRVERLQRVMDEIAVQKGTLSVLGDVPSVSGQ